MKRCLADVNVWFALAVEGQAQHRAAKAWWWGEAAGVIGFVRITQIGLLRPLTSAAAMGGKPRQRGGVGGLRRTAPRRPGTGFPGASGRQPPGSRLPKLWVDAYLAARRW
jgi:hypothetical protein